MILRTRAAVEYGITYTLEQVPRGASSSLGAADNSNPFLERKLETFSSAYNEFNIQTSLGTTFEAVTAGADVSQPPLVARAEGYAGGTVVVKLNNGRTARRVSLNLADTGATLGGWVTTAITAGTAYTDALALVTTLIEASGKDLQIYRDKTTLDPKDIGSGSSRNNIERNPDWWGDSDWDLSGAPIWNSGSNSPKYGMAMVTEDHLLAAHHYKPSVGAYVEFLGANGVVYTRQIIGENSRTPDDAAILDDLHVFTLGPPPTGFVENVTPFELVGPWIHTDGPDGYYGWVVGVSLSQTRKGYFTIGISPIASTATRSGTYNGQSFTVRNGPLVTGVVEVNGSPYLPNQYRLSGGIPGDSGGANFHVTASGLKLAGLFEHPNGGPLPDEALLNAMISTPDANAVARGNLVSPTGRTVTVAPDPTLP